MSTSQLPPSPSPHQRSVVMADVAKAAGVSLQTVSRVLNSHPRVSPETRERVQATIRTLGYRPNPTARALATGRTRTIGVATFDATSYGPAATLNGIVSAANEAGYLLSIVPLQGTGRPPAVEAVDRLARQSVDGIIAIAPQQELSYALANLAGQLPIVALADSAAEFVPVVAVDEQEGARQATQHLLALGHTQVHHLAGPSGWIAAEERAEGWRAALTAAGIVPPVPVSGDWSAESGYRAGLELAKDPDLTAIVAANDLMAAGLLRALHEAGRRVPEEVSVVGFDDVPAAAYLIPSLTTVRPDFAEVGRQCLELLLRQLEHGPGSWEKVRVPTELIQRKSSGVPRPSA